MAKSFFSLNSVSRLLKEAAPGAYTPSSVEKAREIAEDMMKELARKSRQLADYAGRKRVTDEEVKMAAQGILKS